MINELYMKIKNIDIILKKLFDSKIEFDVELVKSWLDNRNFKTELLFRKTRDGSSVNDFHNKCDNKGIIITFIETYKGFKFGGYTELQWDKSGYKKDKSTFIFSFNNKEKYIARNNNNTICCNGNEGPTFGCNFPEIYFDKTLNKGSTYDSKENNTFFNGRKLTNGEEFWNVKELEAFKINYI